MRAPSPTDVAGNIATFTIRANGKVIAGGIQVVSVETWHAVDRIPRARLIVSNGDPTGEALEFGAQKQLAPGVKIEVALGYDSKEATVFSGVVRRQGLRTQPRGPASLVIEASGFALGMTLARSNAVTESATDSEICTVLIRRAGLEAKVTGADTRHEGLVQYHASDWDMLVMRAQANGMVVIADGSRVAVASPDLSASPVLSLAYGESILDMNLEVDGAAEVPDVESHALKSGGKETLEGKAGSCRDHTFVGETSPDIAKTLGVKTLRQQAAGGMTAPELADWSKADQLRRRLAKVRGHVRFPGSSLARVGALVGLEGLGENFSGSAFVSGVSHEVADGAWTTTIEIGLEAAWFAATAPAIAAPPAAGQVPPIHGVQIGVVLKVKGDPADDGRVLVAMPLMPETAGIWARRGPFAGTLKEKDEVALAFLNNDPRYPVVLGSLYSKDNPAPATRIGPVV